MHILNCIIIYVKKCIYFYSSVLCHLENKCNEQVISRLFQYNTNDLLKLKYKYINLNGISFGCNIKLCCLSKRLESDIYIVYRLSSYINKYMLDSINKYMDNASTEIIHRSIYIYINVDMKQILIDDHIHNVTMYIR